MAEKKKLPMMLTMRWRNTQKRAARRGLFNFIYITPKSIHHHQIAFSIENLKGASERIGLLRVITP